MEENFTLEQLFERALQHGLDVSIEKRVGRVCSIELFRYSATAQPGYENSKLASFTGRNFSALVESAMTWLLFSIHGSTSGST